MKKALFTIVALSALALLASCTGDTQDASSTVSTEQTSSVVSTEESSVTESNDTDESSVEESSVDTSTDESSAEESLPEDTQTKEIVTDYKPDNLDELKFKECYTYFYGEYINRPKQITFAEDGADLVLHLAAQGEYSHERYYLVRNTSIDEYYRYCASAIEPYMWFFNYAEEEHVIEVFRSHETDGYTTIAVPENTYIEQLYCKMVDGRVGYLFVFGEGQGNTRELAYLYKTADGGATWQAVECENMPEYHHRDTPIYANFFDENTGLISCRYASLGYLSERTFLTTDGGKTWSYLSALPYPEDMDSSVCTQLADLECIYGQYVMTVGLFTDGASTSPRFVSADLQSWTLLPEELDGCEFKRFDAEVGIFEGADDGNHVIYVTEWDALYTVAGTGYDYLQYYRAGNSLFVFSAHGADNPGAFVLYQLDKGKTDAQTVDLGLPENFANIGCKIHVFDDDSALFVLTEYAEHRAKMYAVFKTTDGGKTWQSIGKQLDETRWPLYEGISKLHFFDKQNGILFREFTDTEYLGDRVLVTTDGGATWFNPEITPDGAELDGADIAEMSFGDGKYTFLIKQYADGDDDAYATFMSDDLVHWELLED